MHVFLIYGDRICLVDSGVSGSQKVIFDYIKKTGRDPAEIAMIVITHAHADHIGGAPEIKQSTGCIAAAHAEDIPWIEDIELQYEERPVPGFHTLAKSSLNVERRLRDNDVIELGEGSFLRVMHTPGHSRGHISLVYKKDRALICGDAVPVPGALPVYEDVATIEKSIKKLMSIERLQVLLSAWDEPRYGADVYKGLQDALDYIHEIDSRVIRARASAGPFNVDGIAADVAGGLGIPEVAPSPLFLKTIEAHLRNLT